jgi:hypothetical protein
MKRIFVGFSAACGEAPVLKPTPLFYPQITQISQIKEIVFDLTTFYFNQR